MRNRTTDCPSEEMRVVRDSATHETGKGEVSMEHWAILATPYYHFAMAVIALLALGFVISAWLAIKLLRQELASLTQKELFQYGRLQRLKGQRYDKPSLADSDPGDCNNTRFVG